MGEINPRREVEGTAPTTGARQPADASARPTSTLGATVDPGSVGFDATPEQETAAPLPRASRRGGITTVVGSRARLPVLLLLGLLVRLVLVPFGGFEPDLALFRDWAARLTTEPLADFYVGQDPTDELPGLLWPLWGVAKLAQAFALESPFDGRPFLVLLKLVPTLADIGIGALLALIGRRMAGQTVGLLAAALYLFNPAPIVLASVWGQWDAVPLLIAVAALWLCLRGSVVLAFPTLAYAAMIKPQFALLFPLLAVAYLRQAFPPASSTGAVTVGPPARGRGGTVPLLARGAAAFASALAVVVLVPLPFGRAAPTLWSRWSLYDRLDGAWDVHRFASVNAVNIWATPLAGIGAPDGRTVLLGFSAREFGLLLLFAASLLILDQYWRRGNDRALVWAFLATTLAFFVLPTRVHERALLPAVAFACVPAALAPGLRWIWAALSALLAASLIAVYALGRDGSGLPFLPFDDPWVVSAGFVSVVLLLYVLVRAPTVLAGRLAPTLGEEWRTLTRWPPVMPRLPAPLARFLAPEAPLWSALLVAGPILTVGLTLSVGWRLQGLPFVDYDYWWHLATGEWILDNGRVPTTDPFSWTRVGDDWVAHEWLAEVLLALANRAGGYAGAIALTTAVVVAGFWWLVAGTRAYGLSRRAACLLALLWGGAIVKEGVMVPRPQVWTFALFAGLLATLAFYDTGRRQRIWLLPPLFALWINLNLTALIGIACLGAFVLDRIVRDRLERRLLIVSFLSLAALLLNPRGPGLLTAVLKYADRDAVRYERIFEWMRPVLLDDWRHLAFVLALPVVPLAAWQVVRLRLWPALPVLALFWQSFTAVRFIPLYVLLAFVFAAWLVRQDALRRGEGATTFPPTARWPTWTPAVAAAATAVALVVATTSVASQFRRDPIPWSYPEEEAAILLEDYADARLFNVYDYGGFLIERFDGAIPVYVDGREEMYGEPFLRRYFELIGGDPGWQTAFAEAGIDVVLVRWIDELSDEMVDDPDWEEVFSDENSVLFVRVPPDAAPASG